MAEDSLKDHWPKAGDSLFAAGSGWETVSRFIHLGPDWFLAYAVGYKKAADAVIEEVEKERLVANHVFLPVFYLYRHYVELMLKGLINLGTKLEDGSSNYPPNHKIDELWSKCRPMLEKAVPGGSKSDTDAVESCITEMVSLDPSFFALRYGEDKKRKRLEPQAKKPVDLANVRKVMNRMAGFLEGSYDYMNSLVQTQADIDS